MMRRGFVCFLMLMATACAKTDLLHELEEREANEIVVLLDQKGVSAGKLADEGSASNKGPRYRISVASGDANQAWKILNEFDLPRKKDMGFGEVFSQSGLIPTASEERAKMLQAIQGELTRTLKSVDGILDARVHVVIPEDSVLKVKEEDKAEPTASVWYKYRGQLGKAPLTEQQIQDLVANAIEKLKPERVKVVATRGLVPGTDELSAGSGFSEGGTDKIMGIHIAKNDVRTFKAIVAGAVFLVVLFACFLVYAMMRGSSAATPSSRLPSRSPPDAG